ncbi:hypothetical protein PENTCL1PPCAC_30754, partial [Pristionchus entomophagus]
IFQMEPNDPPTALLCDYWKDYWTNRTYKDTFSSSLPPLLVPAEPLPVGDHSDESPTSSGSNGFAVRSLSAESSHDTGLTTSSDYIEAPSHTVDDARPPSPFLDDTLAQAFSPVPTSGDEVDVEPDDVNDEAGGEDARGGGTSSHGTVGTHSLPSVWNTGFYNETGEWQIGESCKGRHVLQPIDEEPKESFHLLSCNNKDRNQEDPLFVTTGNGEERLLQRLAQMSSNTGKLAADAASARFGAGAAPASAPPVLQPQQPPVAEAAPQQSQPPQTRFPFGAVARPLPQFLPQPRPVASAPIPIVAPSPQLQQLQQGLRGYETPASPPPPDPAQPTCPTQPTFHVQHWVQDDPTPPQPTSSTLHNKCIPGWKTSVGAALPSSPIPPPLLQPVVLLAELVQPITVTSPVCVIPSASRTTSKNLLGRNAGQAAMPRFGGIFDGASTKPPYMRQEEAPVPAKLLSEEREEAEKRKIEEYKKRFGRIVRRLSLERSAADDSIETSSRLHELDRLASWKELTREGLAEALKGTRRRSHSHNGKWRHLDAETPNTSRWFNKEKEKKGDRDEKLGDLDAEIGQGRSESLYSDDSQMTQENERKLEFDRENLHWQRGFVIRSFPRPGKLTFEFEIFTLQGRKYLLTTNTIDLSTLRVKFALLPNGEAIVRKSSYCCSALFTLNLRIGKLLKITSTAIVAYRHPDCERPWLMW